MNMHTVCPFALMGPCKNAYEWLTSFTKSMKIYKECQELSHMFINTIVLL